MDFVKAHNLAERFFTTREQAAENFELLARLMEDAMCMKLGGAAAPSPPAETAGHLTGLVDALSLRVFLYFWNWRCRRAKAVDAMANPRLQAERLWMAAGEAVKAG